MRNNLRGVIDMKCRNCGTEQGRGKFCQNCGKPLPAPQHKTSEKRSSSAQGKKGYQRKADNTASSVKTVLLPVVLAVGLFVLLILGVFLYFVINLGKADKANTAELPAANLSSGTSALTPVDSSAPDSGTESEVSAPAETTAPETSAPATFEVDGVTYNAVNETVVTTARVNARTSPDTSSEDNIIKTMALGTEVTRTGISADGEWSQITLDGQTAYCSSSFVAAPGSN